MGKKGILLALIEAVNFIDKEDGWGPALLLEIPGLVDNLSDFFDPGEHRREKDEIGGGRMGEDGRQGGLARTGRTPEQQGWNSATFDQLREEFPRTNQVLLADEMLEPSWTHPFGERTVL